MLHLITPIPYFCLIDTCKVLHYTQVPGWSRVDLLQDMRYVFEPAAEGSSALLRRHYLTSQMFTNAELKAHVKPDVLGELMMEVRRPFHIVYTAPVFVSLRSRVRRKGPDPNSDSSDSDAIAEAAKVEARRTKYIKKLSQSSRMFIDCYKRYLQEDNRWPEDDKAKMNFSL